MLNYLLDNVLFSHSAFEYSPTTLFYCNYQGSLPSDLVVEFCKDVQKRSQEVRKYDILTCHFF